MIFQVNDVRELIYILISVIVALSAHEFGHAYVAFKCGDNTARNFGRLTLNPINHIDIFGFISMLIAGFGWAKPVPINMRNFRKPRRDTALVSLAGPAVNFILGFIGVLLYSIFFSVLYKLALDGKYDGFLFKLCENGYLLFMYFALLNIGLGVFNLIPIPPLDGSKILGSVLPPKWGMKYIMLERYAGIFMVFLLLASRLSQLDFLFYPLEWLRGIILTGFEWVVDLIPFITIPF